MEENKLSPEEQKEIDRILEAERKKLIQEKLKQREEVERLKTIDNLVEEQILKVAEEQEKLDKLTKERNELKEKYNRPKVESLKEGDKILVYMGKKDKRKEKSVSFVKAGKKAFKVKSGGETHSVKYYDFISVI